MISDEKLLAIVKKMYWGLFLGQWKNMIPGEEQQIVKSVEGVGKYRLAWAGHLVSIDSNNIYVAAITDKENWKRPK